MAASHGVDAELSGLCDRLSGRSTPLTAALIEAARRHRVHLLIAATLTPEEQRTPIAAELGRELRTAAVKYVGRERALRDVVDRLAGAAVPAVVIKGAGLAYAVYPEPFLRPRVDIDLLVPRRLIERAEAVLLASGWTREVESDREVAAAQRHYRLAIGPDRDELLDLHWRIVNPPAFAHALSGGELIDRAVPVPALGASARMAAPGEALFLACVHLVAHHGHEEPPLLWLSDIHRLAEALDPSSRSRFLELASRPSMAAVCGRGLRAAGRCFGGAAVAGLLAALPDEGDAGPVARLAEPGSRWSMMRADLSSMTTWRDRLTLLREHLFPSLAYMQSKYPRCPPALLPLASIHRIVAGLPDWFRTRPRR